MWWWTHIPSCEQTDTHDCQHYLPSKYLCGWPKRKLKCTEQIYVNVILPIAEVNQDKDDDGDDDDEDNYNHNTYY